MSDISFDVFGFCVRNAVSHAALVEGCTAKQQVAIAKGVHDHFRDLKPLGVRSSSDDRHPPHSVARNFALPTKAALQAAENALGAPCSGLGAAAAKLGKLGVKNTLAKNSATKMLRSLASAEGLDRHFTECGTQRWLNKLEQLLCNLAAENSLDSGDVTSEAVTDDSSLDPLVAADPWSATAVDEATDCPAKHGPSQSDKVRVPAEDAWKFWKAGSLGDTASDAPPSAHEPAAVAPSVATDLQLPPADDNFPEDQNVLFGKSSGPPFLQLQDPTAGQLVGSDAEHGQEVEEDSDGVEGPNMLPRWGASNEWRRWYGDDSGGSDEEAHSDLEALAAACFPDKGGSDGESVEPTGSPGAALQPTTMAVAGARPRTATYLAAATGSTSSDRQATSKAVVASRPHATKCSQPNRRKPNSTAANAAKNIVWVR